MDLKRLEEQWNKAKSFHVCISGEEHCETCRAGKFIYSAFPEILKQFRDMQREMIDLQQQLMQKNIDLMDAQQKIRAGEALAKAIRSIDIDINNYQNLIDGSYDVFKIDDDWRSKCDAIIADYEKAIK